MSTFQAWDFFSPPTPNLVVTPALHYSTPKFNTPTHIRPSTVNLTQEAQEGAVSLDSIPQPSQQPNQDKSFSELVALDPHSAFSDEEIRSILSCWERNLISCGTQSDPGVSQAGHMVQFIQQKSAQ